MYVCTPGLCVLIFCYLSLLYSQVIRVGALLSRRRVGGSRGLSFGRSVEKGLLPPPQANQGQRKLSLASPSPKKGRRSPLLPLVVSLILRCQLLITLSFVRKIGFSSQGMRLWMIATFGALSKNTSSRTSIILYPSLSARCSHTTFELFSPRPLLLRLFILSRPWVGKACGHSVQVQLSACDVVLCHSCDEG